MLIKGMKKLMVGLCLCVSYCVWLLTKIRKFCLCATKNLSHHRRFFLSPSRPPRLSNFVSNIFDASQKSTIYEKSWKSPAPKYTIWRRRWDFIGRRVEPGLVLRGRPPWAWRIPDLAAAVAPEEEETFWASNLNFKKNVWTNTKGWLKCNERRCGDSEIGSALTTFASINFCGSVIVIQWIWLHFHEFLHSISKIFHELFHFVLGSTNWSTSREEWLAAASTWADSMGAPNCCLQSCPTKPRM